MSQTLFLGFERIKSLKLPDTMSSWLLLKSVHLSVCLSNSLNNHLFFSNCSLKNPVKDLSDCLSNFSEIFLSIRTISLKGLSLSLSDHLSDFYETSVL